MGKKIIVAGAGHGGLSAAMNLAKKGYDVTVYEAKSEGTLGYDWNDVFEVKVLPDVGFPLPKEGVVDRMAISYYGPDLSSPLTQNVKSGEIDMFMNRKDLYAHLLKYCVKAGVKFVYDCKVEAPIMLGCRVVGIKTEKGDFYGDMIIDALGIDSTLREQLPQYLKIQNSFKKYDVLYTYRAIFNRKPGSVLEGPSYRVYITERGTEGLKWCVTFDDRVDVLIGRFEEPEDGKIESVLEWLREQNPTLGDELLSGGGIYKIPIRCTPGLFVADGYACVGDSAYMTMPIMGSGIAASLRAGKMLAKTMINDKNDEFTREKLWSYQIEYLKKFGFDFGTIAMFKSMMTYFEESDIAFLVSEGVLNNDDITFTPEDSSLKSMFSSMKIPDIVDKAKKGKQNATLVKGVTGMGLNYVKLVSLIKTCPGKYSSAAVEKWAEKYDAFYDSLYDR